MTEETKAQAWDRRSTIRAPWLPGLCPQPKTATDANGDTVLIAADDLALSFAPSASNFTANIPADDLAYLFRDGPPASYITALRAIARGATAKDKPSKAWLLAMEDDELNNALPLTAHLSALSGLDWRLVGGPGARSEKRRKPFPVIRRVLGPKGTYRIWLLNERALAAREAPQAFWRALLAAITEALRAASETPAEALTRIEREAAAWRNAKKESADAEAAERAATLNAEREQVRGAPFLPLSLALALQIVRTKEPPADDDLSAALEMVRVYSGLRPRERGCWRDWAMTRGGGAVWEAFVADLKAGRIIAHGTPADGAISQPIDAAQWSAGLLIMEPPPVFEVWAQPVSANWPDGRPGWANVFFANGAATAASEHIPSEEYREAMRQARAVCDAMDPQARIVLGHVRDKIDPRPGSSVWERMKPALNKQYPGRIAAGAPKKFEARE